MFLGLFIVAEFIGYTKGFSTRPALENIIRGGIDVGIVGALLGSAATPVSRDRPNSSIPTAVESRR